MRERKMDLWELPADVIGVTTNGVVRDKNGMPVLVMGGGSAREARDSIPGIDATLGQYVRQYGNRCFRVQLQEFTLLSFPTKEHYRDKSSLDLIVQSCEQSMEMADKFGWEEIRLPRPGCGLGGLKWPTVKKAIGDLLDDRFVIVTFPDVEHSWMVQPAPGVTAREYLAGNG